MQVLLRSYGTHQLSDILIDPDAGIRSARQTRWASTQHRVAGERVWMATTDRGVEFGPKVGVCEELTVSRKIQTNTGWGPERVADLANHQSWLAGAMQRVYFSGTGRTSRTTATTLTFDGEVDETTGGRGPESYEDTSIGFPAAPAPVPSRGHP